jgi:hypothetical protein
MPPKKSRRLDQCQYREDNVRCIKSGTGSPCLCRAHKIAAEQAARNEAPSHSPKAGIADLLNDFITGRPFDPSKAGAVIDDFAKSWGIGGGFTGYSPDIDTGQPPHGARFDPPPDFRPPPRWHREEPPPPEPDRRSAVDVQRARNAMGFGPADPLTEDLINQRRRQLARRHHPDRGGSTSRMSTINDAADVLLESLQPLRDRA